MQAEEDEENPTAVLDEELGRGAGMCLEVGYDADRLPLPKKVIGWKVMKKVGRGYESPMFHAGSHRIVGEEYSSSKYWIPYGEKFYGSYKTGFHVYRRLEDARIVLRFEHVICEYVICEVELTEIVATGGEPIAILGDKLFRVQLCPVTVGQKMKILREVKS